MKKGYVCKILAATAALSVSGCFSFFSMAAESDVTAASDTIKFGLVAPLSGDNGAYGTKQEKGYELAMEEINAAGGVLGATLELETYDDC